MAGPSFTPDPSEADFSMLKFELETALAALEREKLDHFETHSSLAAADEIAQDLRLQLDALTQQSKVDASALRASAEALRNDYRKEKANSDAFELMLQQVKEQANTTEQTLKAQIASILNDMNADARSRMEMLDETKAALRSTFLALFTA